MAKTLPSHQPARAFRTALSASCTLAMIFGALGGCSTDDGASLPTVAVAFYPLEFLVSYLAGDGVDVVQLTRPGLEPHEIDLSPKEVGTVRDADLVVYLKGFQTAIDEAAKEGDDHKLFDVGPHADLMPADSVAKGADPHFWLDPQRMMSVARALAPQIIALRPSLRSNVNTQLTAFERAVNDIDSIAQQRLSSCEVKPLVTSHNAFAYFATRYGFTEVGIAGLSPESEPSAKRLSEVADLASRSSVSTIYFETLVDPAIATTIANETGATTAVLDPIEAITSASKGNDYFEVMRSNISTVAKGQRCK